MTKFTIFYYNFNEDIHISEDNIYFDILFGRELDDYADAIRKGLFIKAAEAEVNGGFEELFFQMQNLDEGRWSNRINFKCFTKFPRSQSVGDIIYIHDTDAFWRVANLGHHRIDKPEAIEAFRAIL